MEGEMIYWGRIVYSCFSMVLVVCASVLAVFIEKRLSHPSGLRNIFAVVVGVGVSVVSVWILHEVGSEVSVKNSYFLIETPMTDEMIRSKQSQLAFNVSIINLSVLVLEIGVSILGGYVGGKVARENELANGLLIGIGFAVLSIGLGYGYFFWEQISGLKFILMQVIRLCATILGAYLALVQRNRNLVNLGATGKT